MERNAKNSPLNQPKGFVKRVGGYLHRFVPVVDSTGKIVDYIAKPLMIELKPRDIFQIIIGASMMALPLSFTEETWRLSEELPMGNIISLTVIGFVLMALFVYFNFYRHELRGNLGRYLIRLLAIFFISHAIVAVLLTILMKAPWQSDLLLAIRRVLLIAFPAQLTASVSDVLK